jgi:membrane-bound lytic murein transglycosylase MltF
MGHFGACAVAAVLGMAVSVGAPAQAPAAKPSTASGSAAAATVGPRDLDLSTSAVTGDFDTMLRRRSIRFYVPYSRSLYFIDKGRERGISADLIRAFERWVNRKYAAQLGNRPLTAFVVPATRDTLLADLLEGRADVAVGNIKAIDALREAVDFVAPDEAVASAEILVTGPSSPAISSIDDLSGKVVHLRERSSQTLSVQALNKRFVAAGKPPVVLVFVPHALEDEDLLEMLNAGLLQAVVVDDWKARMWAQVLTRVKLHEDVQLLGKTRTGWAIRQDSPRLMAELNEFYAYYAKHTGGVPALQRQYMKRVRALGNATAGEDYRRFSTLVEHFQEYGRRYDLEPFLLAAQGYQESALNQDARSAVGAIGVMQVMPATGAQLKVGDIRQIEPNIHAGAKYMDQLMTRYFQDARFDEQNRSLFAFASYNAGPGNIRKMRTEAERRGLDPNQWFNHVEIVTAEKIGIETTTYVRNIFKYYGAYKLATQARQGTAAAREQVPEAKR